MHLLHRQFHPENNLSSNQPWNHINASFASQRSVNGFREAEMVKLPKFDNHSFFKVAEISNWNFEIDIHKQ